MLQLATSSHSLEKRDYVIRELVDTECNYVDVLSKIIKHFMRPLMPYLKPQDLQVIFFGVKVRFLRLLTWQLIIVAEDQFCLRQIGKRIERDLLFWKSLFVYISDNESKTDKLLKKRRLLENLDLFLRTNN